MNKSSFKENSSNITPLEGLKRRKVDEMNMSESAAKNIDCSERNLSKIYEDDSDINYMHKSARARLTSTSRRSPLATINKANNQHSSQQEFANNQIPSTSKTPLKQQSETTHLKIVQKVPSAIDPFNLLSDELLLHIFKYLPKKALNRIAQVNSRFDRVTADESLWIRMDLANRVISRGAFGRLLPRGFIILRLAQARVESPIFEPGFIFEGFQSKLQYLDLSLASINKQSLAQLFSTCRSLKKLSLEQVPLDAEVCKQIAENRNLEVLNLAMCEEMTTECVSIMMRNLQSLTALNISWTQLSLEGTKAVVTLVSPLLMRLNISGFRKTFTDSMLETLVNRCPNIVELDASDCPMLTAAAIQTLSKLNKLEYLSLSRCYNISVTTYLSLNVIKSLMFLDVFGLLSEAGIQMLEKSFKNIGINKFIHSSVARPTVEPRRTSIWGLKTRD